MEPGTCTLYSSSPGDRVSGAEIPIRGSTVSPVESAENIPKRMIPNARRSSTGEPLGTLPLPLAILAGWVVYTAS